MASKTDVSARKELKDAARRRRFIGACGHDVIRIRVVSVYGDMGGFWDCSTCGWRRKRLHED
jgi:hypothetical protein